VLAEALLSPDAWGQRYQETFDLYLAFSACEFDLLSRRVILKFHIEVVDETALQRIKRVVALHAHD
jgi:hypothetical protein